MKLTPPRHDERDQLLTDSERIFHRQELVVHAQHSMLLDLDGDHPSAERDDRVDVGRIAGRHLQPRFALRRERDLARSHDTDTILDVAGFVYELDLSLREHAVTIPSGERKKLDRSS